jgi:hypothetical protein
LAFGNGTDKTAKVPLEALNGEQGVATLAARGTSRGSPSASLKTVRDTGRLLDHGPP